MRLQKQSAVCFNQLPVVFETGGLAFLKSQSLRRREFDTTNPINSGLFVGACGEHTKACDTSAAALNNHYQRSGTDFPVMRTEWSGDHAFSLLGDPREVNAREVVVLDAWPTKPSAHTLDQNELYGNIHVSSSTTQVVGGFCESPYTKCQITVTLALNLIEIFLVVKGVISHDHC